MKRQEGGELEFPGGCSTVGGDGARYGCSTTPASALMINAARDQDGEIILREQDVEQRLLVHVQW